MGERRGSRVTSSWAPWAGPIYPHSSVSSNLPSPLIGCNPKLISSSQVGCNYLSGLSLISGADMSKRAPPILCLCVTRFCPFYPLGGTFWWDCPVSTLELPLHLRRHRHLSTTTRTHSRVYLNRNETHKHRDTKTLSQIHCSLGSHQRRVKAKKFPFGERS